MPAYQYTNEAQPDPLGPLVELLDGSSRQRYTSRSGSRLGLIAVRVMRRRHLRWTWAPCALPVVLFAHSIFAGWATTLSTAALCASARGRHWHVEDLMVGGDLAEIAAERRGPLDALRALARDVSRAHGFAGHAHGLCVTSVSRWDARRVARRSRFRLETKAAVGTR